MACRAILRFKCTHIIEDHKLQEVLVVFEPVYRNVAENRIFYGESSPSGRIELTVSNPDTREHFKPGREYQVHFVEAC